MSTINETSREKSTSNAIAAISKRQAQVINASLWGDLRLANDYQHRYSYELLIEKSIDTS